MKSLLVLLILVGGCSTAPKKTEKKYLESWNDGEVKSSIISFVKNVTNKDSKDFIPVADRIATFDNDGTLWAEQPIVQGMFAMVKAQAMGMKTKPKHPMTDKEMIELFVKTHTGMSEEEFEKEVKEFFAKAVHPKLGVPISQTLYQPQLELLTFLRDHHFTVYISSGGTIDFMRMISQQFYGVPVENVIGSSFKYSYDEAGNKIMRMPKFEYLNDKAGKPVSIHKHIGKRPVFACGNVGGEGDLEMLRYSQGSNYRSFQLIVNHDDAEREFVYSEKSGKSLNWAKKYQWNVISIKEDWKNVFNK